MKKTIFFSLIVAVCIFGCGKKNSVIPAKKMQAVLTDVHYAEAYSMLTQKDTVLKGNKKNIDSLASFYAMIFKHHKITQQEYYNSLDWYKNHPIELDSIYVKMIPEFTTQEDIYQ